MVGWRGGQVGCGWLEGWLEVDGCRVGLDGESVAQVGSCEDFLILSTVDLRIAPDFHPIRC